MRVAPMLWGCLLGQVLASVGPGQEPAGKQPDLEVPADLRAALFALPVQPSPASGVTVRVVDDASGEPLAGAHVFVPDQSKWQAIMSRVPRPKDDLERAMLAPLLWTAAHYVTGADGTVLVPVMAHPFAYAVTAEGFGMVGPARGAAADSTQIEGRIWHFETFVVRAVSADGKAVASLPIEIGPYGERGIDRFEPMLTETADERGEVRMRMPGFMARGFMAKGARICAQPRIVGAEPMRIPLAVATDGTSTVMLTVPPMGRVIVRLHDETEKPRGGLVSVRLLRAGERPSAPMLDRAVPQRQGEDEASFDFVTLGEKLTAHIRADGIAGEVVHEQEGPTRPGELVVFAVRVKNASPMLAVRLLDEQGMAVVKQAIAVLFVNESLVAQQEATTGADGALRIAIPDHVAGAACRVFVVRRGGDDGAGTVYAGAAMRDLDAGASGLRDLGELQLEQEPVAVAGRLVDTKGAPIADVTVLMPVTWATSRGDRISMGPTKGVLGRALMHRATTDAEGRFVFRELAPRATAGPFEIGAGEWQCAPLLRVPTGRAERNIAVRKAGSLRLTFRQVPPATMPVRLQQAGEDYVCPVRIDEPTGSRHFARVHPGRYDVSLIVGGREALRIDGIEVRAGEECDDLRLREIDWAKGLQIVKVHGARGCNLRAIGANDRAAGGLWGVPSDPYTLVLAEGQQRFVATNERHLTVLFDRPGAEVHVKWVPRRPLQLVLPKGIELPTGLGIGLTALAFPASLGPQSFAMWTGAGTEISADGAGRHRLALHTGDQGRGTVLWSCEIEVGEGSERVAIVLPITAEELKDVRDKVAGSRGK